MSYTVKVRRITIELEDGTSFSVSSPGILSLMISMECEPPSLFGIPSVRRNRALVEFKAHMDLYAPGERPETHVGTRDNSLSQDEAKRIEAPQRKICQDTPE